MLVGHDHGPNGNELLQKISLATQGMLHVLFYVILFL